MLTCLCRELALHPEIQNKLRDEIYALVKADPMHKLTVMNTTNSTYLKAVIDETLRLWNPVPCGVQSITGPKGATIAGTYVPPRTSVRVPYLALMTGKYYSLERTSLYQAYTTLADERYFPRGKEFIPERWTIQPELVKDRRAFVPFA